MHQNIWINSMGGGRREVGAELHSLGHQRAAPQWWRDSEKIIILKSFDNLKLRYIIIF